MLGTIEHIKRGIDVLESRINWAKEELNQAILDFENACKECEANNFDCYSPYSVITLYYRLSGMSTIIFAIDYHDADEVDEILRSNWKTVCKAEEMLNI